VLEVLDAQPAVSDAPDAVELERISQGIELREVVFGYGDRPALEGVSLRLPVGKVVAVVGPSGSGKSTLVSLLMRFEQPQQGRLEVDGVDAGRYTQRSLRAQFSLVTQDAQLFSGPVIDNLRLGRPSASQAEVEAAAKVAAAEVFIQALPQGYQTPIGERGVVLSGGQRQRLALARAVLSGAPVLVLDEATSNLDPESEREVQQALKAVLKERTALVIAHRLSTVQEADLIYVMERGRVVERGNHRELLAQGGAYSRLWSLQEQPQAQGSAA